MINLILTLIGLAGVYGIILIYGKIVEKIKKHNDSITIFLFIFWFIYWDGEHLIDILRNNFDIGFLHAFGLIGDALFFFGLDLLVNYLYFRFIYRYIN